MTVMPMLAAGTVPLHRTQANLDRPTFAAALVSFAREIRFTLVVAESSETPAKLNARSRLGGDMVEGSLFSRSSPISEQGRLFNLAARFERLGQTRARRHAG